MKPAGTVRMLGCVGSRNGVRGAKVEYKAINKMIPMNLCTPPSIFVSTELTFIFVSDSNFWRVSNVGFHGVA